MQQTKAQALHHKVDGLAEGMARKLMEIYNELANTRYVISVLVNKEIDTYPELNEEDVIDDLKKYYLVTDNVAINLDDNSFVKFNLITRNYSLQDVTEEGKYSFKYEGILIGNHQDRTIEATNEIHAWQVLREILINDVKGK
jgi:hypothetical protein